MPFRLSFRDIRFGSEIRPLCKIGVPLALQDLLTNVSFLAICAFVNRLGLDASNGYGIAQKINSFIMLIPASLIQCMASFVAQNVGAKKEDRAKRGMYYGMSLGFCIGLFIAAFAFFRGDLLATVFTSDPQAIAKAFEYLRGLAPEAFLTCILFSFMGYFNGHARSTFVMVQGLIQSFSDPAAHFLVYEYSGRRFSDRHRSGCPGIHLRGYSAVLALLPPLKPADPGYAQINNTLYNPETEMVSGFRFLSIVTIFSLDIPNPSGIIEP